MAETFLSPVIEKLVELLAEEVKSLKGVHKEVKSLKDELRLIQPFLRDAEAKATTGEVTDATKEWLNQIREEADRIEYVIDEYLHHLGRHQHQHGFIGCLQKAGDCMKALKPSHQIASEIRDIKESLCEIKGRGQDYGLRPFEQGATSSITVSNVDAPVDPRLGSLYIDNEELVGVDSKSKELIRSLVEGPSTRMAISLVGEGGIGKTTLANKIYNEETLKEQFDCFAWITVSQSYKVENILKSMRYQMCHTKEQHSGETDAIKGLINLLRNYLQSKRYVVVFDDVWKTEFWDVIKHALPNNNKGSRIIITTRNTSIADYIRETSWDHVEELKTWSLELAWELFCKKAFAFESERQCPPKLDQLSREIVRKCQGLPLVIAAVAGLLSTKEKTEFEWKRVLGNLNNEFEKNPKLTFVPKVLSLSYNDLPYHLKSCFLYFGIFPEDYSILKQRLCRLWIAEGFIKSRRDKTLEEVAEEYLSELIHRNLVSCEIRFGSETSYRVHDLIHEIILEKADELGFCQIFSENQLRFKRKSCRLSIYGTTKNVLESIGDSKICSIFLFDIDELTESFLISLFEKFKLLKVLDFEDASLDDLPKEVGRLYNLKYLSLKRTGVKMLPKSIGKLHNLQTLNLSRTSVQELPKEVKKLRNLQLLSVYPDSNLVTGATCASIQGIRMHKGFGCLEKLQTLRSVEAYPNNISFVKELERLRKLKVLEITKLTAEIGKALGASIEKMNYLEELYLTAVNEDEIIDLKSISSPPFLLNYLDLMCRLQQLPDWISELQNLRGLVLSFSRLIDDPLKRLKGLPKLRYLCFHQAYDGEELHFEEGGFQHLKDLRLQKLQGLKEVKIDSGALPFLEKLDFGSSPLMEEMPSDIQHLTNLKSLTVFDMPNEFVVDLQPDGGLHHWIIQHVPSVEFWYNVEMGTYDVYKLGDPTLLKFLEE